LQATESIILTSYLRTSCEACWSIKGRDMEALARHAFRWRPRERYDVPNNTRKIVTFFELEGLSLLAHSRLSIDGHFLELALPAAIS